MIDLETSSSRREDSFLSSRGVDQSTVAMVGAILVVAFLLLSLIGRDATRPPSVADETAATASVRDDAAPDIAGTVAPPDENN